MKLEKEKRTGAGTRHCPFFVQRQLLGVVIVVFVGAGGLCQSRGADRDPILRQSRSSSLLSGLGSSGSGRIVLELDRTSLNGMNGHSSPPDLYRLKAKEL